MARFDMRDKTPQEAYHLVTRVVAPRPIAWVSSTDAQGRGNLAPFSYFMMGGSNPPSCVICPVNDRHERGKDTLDNIRRTGEFVINVATAEQAEAINDTSYPYPAGVDELQAIGLTSLPATAVSGRRVAESPIQLECRLVQIVEHGTGALASNYIIAEIVTIHVADDLLDDHGLPDDRRIPFLARMGAGRYRTGGETLELPRPQRPKA